MVQRKVTDHLGRLVEFSYPPKRIVSLVPGITDTLFSLNLQKEVVGRTRFCVHPKGLVDQVLKVAGTKDINLEKIRIVNPDLIFCEKEENTKEIVDQLEKEFPVFVCEIQSVHDVYKMIDDLGALTDRKREAESLRTKIAHGFDRLPRFSGKRFAYVIWKKPYMVVGNHTYIDSVFQSIGFENAFSTYAGRYPVVNEEDLQNAKLDYLFLASEPYPFKDSHREEFLDFLPEVPIKILDGEMFWYGPRMVEAVKYFQRILNEL